MNWTKVLEILDTAMVTPESYGWFHIFFFVLSIVVGVALCFILKDGKKHAPNVVLVTSVVVLLLEVYKMINFGFTYEGEIDYDFPWGSFPFQFCSTPMYVGLAAGLLRKGRIHESLCAYLATYAVFAGLCVMIYPGDVFVETIGINIQTMICHGTMISVGAALFAGGHVKLEHKTILKALPVFAVCVAIACVMNELARVTGLLERESFNMFYFSPYVAPSLPVYSLVQGVVPFPWSLIIYIAGFTAAAYLMLLIAKGIGSIKRNKVAA